MSARPEGCKSSQTDPIDRSSMSHSGCISYPTTHQLRSVLCFYKRSLLANLVQSRVTQSSYCRAFSLPESQGSHRADFKIPGRKERGQTGGERRKHRALLAELNSSRSDSIDALETSMMSAIGCSALPYTQCRRVELERKRVVEDGQELRKSWSIRRKEILRLPTKPSSLPLLSSTNDVLIFLTW